MSNKEILVRIPPPEEPTDSFKEQVGRLWVHNTTPIKPIIQHVIEENKADLLSSSFEFSGDDVLVPEKDCT